MLIVLLSCLLLSCQGLDAGKTSLTPCSDLTHNEKDHSINSGIRGALLATRFESLEDLRSAIQVEYRSDKENMGEDDLHEVQLTHCSGAQRVVSILRSGVSERDIRFARKGSFWEKAGLGLSSPYLVANRRDLQRVNMLARRMQLEFGVDDVAFFDLAEAAVSHIRNKAWSYRFARDKGEKGYLNSFNHITAQAFVTSIYSEELADYIADLHELHNMPELITGNFTQEQLSDPHNNPVDNYVDMINNEWGQELGKQLKAKYNITTNTIWTPVLLSNYLNDLQQYYSWAFQIPLKPFQPEDVVVARFSKKINRVMRGEGIVWE